jgi:uncharacterized RDD family membrane protein YckC
MTTTSDDYIGRVIQYLPRAGQLRDQIARELRGLFAERMEHGQSEDDVARQLGDPMALAESYLAAVPLVAPGLFERFAAKVADFFIISAVIVPAFCLLWLAVRATSSPFGGALLIVAAISGIMSLPAYTLVLEYALGYTLGKRLFNMRVVRESGARIGLGQSFVRQLPFVGQIFFIDVLFVLFTDKRQRAFEMASKTRVVKAGD